MVNINSLERDGLCHAELCPRNTMMKNINNTLIPDRLQSGITQSYRPTCVLLSTCVSDLFVYYSLPVYLTYLCIITYLCIQPIYVYCLLVNQTYLFYCPHVYQIYLCITVFSCIGPLCVLLSTCVSDTYLCITAFSCIRTLCVLLSTCVSDTYLCITAFLCIQPMCVICLLVYQTPTCVLSPTWVCTVFTRLFLQISLCRKKGHFSTKYSCSVS